MILVVPLLEHAALGRDLLPAVGREDRGDVHGANGDPEHRPVALRVEVPLPDPAYQERTFQTKSLACSLSDSTITREGRLKLREVEWAATPEEELPYYGTLEWEQGEIVRLFGWLHEKSARDGILDDFQGDIIFYDTVNAPKGAVFVINFQGSSRADRVERGDLDRAPVHA